MVMLAMIALLFVTVLLRNKYAVTCSATGVDVEDDLEPQAVPPQVRTIPTWQMSSMTARAVTDLNLWCFTKQYAGSLFLYVCGYSIFRRRVRIGGCLSGLLP